MVTFKPRPAGHSRDYTEHSFKISKERYLEEIEKFKNRDIIEDYMVKAQELLYPNTIVVSDRITKKMFPEDTRTENEITSDFVCSIINRT